MFTRKTWFWFTAAAFVGFLCWFRLAYPQLAFIDLSVDRSTALRLATDYLKNDRGVDIRRYRSAIIFVSAGSSDVYLQKSLGFREELAFFKKYQYELFFWKIRFFREQEKEEYGVLTSAGTGEVTDYYRIIEDNATRPDEGKESAQQRVQDILQKRFKFDLGGDFILHGDSSKKLDNRTDYIFQWENKGVFIQWSKNKEDGGAKLLTSASVSGPEVLSFYKNKLEIPDQFNRYFAKRRSVGQNFSVFFRCLFLGLFFTTVFLVAVGRNNLVMHNIKKMAIGLAATFFGLSLLSYFNHYQSVLFGYPTTISFAAYLWQNISNLVVDVFLASVTILLPCLAAESLHSQTFPEKREGRFLPYWRSVFPSRQIARMILLGYLVAIIMFGIQSVAFAFGEKYLGVWTEHVWLASLSGNTFPFLAAFTIGFTASLSEEIFFRMFGISLGKKYLKNTFAAVLLSSLSWGFGHSNYPVFPMWFRGLEVTALGLFLSYAYLRFGIVTVLVGHYLFDVFWYSAAYVLGHATSTYFYSALAVLLLPLLAALIAYLWNEPAHERPLRWNLNRHQLYNLGILKNFLRPKIASSPQSSPQVKEEVISHGWDPAVVETALEDLQSENAFQKHNKAL